MMSAAIMATKLAMVSVSTSLFLICEISWAMTASSSRGVRRRMIESVTATTACFGLLPVANALGTGVCMMATRGFGIPAPVAHRSTILWSSGYSSGSITRALVLQSTRRSEKKYWRNAIRNTITTRNGRPIPSIERTAMKAR